MSDLQQGLENDPSTIEVDEGPHGSVWADLRRQHTELVAERDPLYLQVPGYDQLVVKYRYVPLHETKGSTEALRKVKNITDAMVIASIDSLLLACEELMVTHPDGTIPVGHDGEELFGLPLIGLANVGDPPIRYDDQLCTVMGWPTGKKARQIVRNLFGDNDRQLLEHAQELAEWTSAAAREVRSDFTEG